TSCLGGEFGGGGLHGSPPSRCMFGPIRSRIRIVLAPLPPRSYHPFQPRVPGNLEGFARCAVPIRCPCWWDGWSSSSLPPFSPPPPAAPPPPDPLPLFPPPGPPLPPAVMDKSGIVNPIDTFLRARLEAEGLTASPPADKLRLLRRVTFDLTGLPPTVAEQEAF